MDHAILIYGAYGYTGRLIAEAMVDAGLKPTLAGRNPQKAAAIGDELDLPHLSFALDEHEHAAKALGPFNVVVHCAGPFENTADPMVRACIAAKTHYLDIAGEVADFEQVLALADEAEDAGVMLMPGVGYGVVPTDCLALYLARRLPDAVKLTLAFEAEGGVSRGTLKTLLKDIHKPGFRRESGLMKTALPASEVRTIEFAGRRVRMALNPWRADLLTAPRSTGIETVDTFTAFPGPLVGLMRMARLLGGLTKRKAFRSLVFWVAERAPAGPTEKELHEGATYTWGMVENEKGERAAALLAGPEAYQFTARTASWVAEHVAKGKMQPGFRTPGEVFGLDPLQAVENHTLQDL